MENDTAKNGGAPDVAETVRTLLSNEELMKNIRSLFAQSAQTASQPDATEVGSAAAPASDSEKEEPPVQQGELLPPVANLQELLNEPAVAEKLPQLMAMLGPMLQHAKEEHPFVDETDSKKRNPQNRENLLRALKPFLSPGRQTAVDSIMRISQLGQILQQLK